MKQQSYAMDLQSRKEVLEAIQEVCAFRNWSLLAAHVRTNHAHAIMEAECKPEKIMNDIKAYASRKLNELEGPNHKRWARHGSTRRLWQDADVREAIRYVIEGQRDPMAVFVAGLI